MPKEYEIKFGTFKNKNNSSSKNSKSKFESQVSKNKYYKILNLPLFNSVKEYSRNINLIDDGIRKTINLDRDNTPLSEETITKTKVETTNYPNRDARLSVSNEKTTNKKAKEGLVRYKFRITRYSDLLPDWKFDFTIANHFSITNLDFISNKNSKNSKNNNSSKNNLNKNNSNKNNSKKNKIRSLIRDELNKSKPFYQVEAEYLKAKKPPQKEIDFIIEKFNSVNIIIELESIIKERLNFHSFISQVKNMDLKELVRLEGNYAVTDKADGERALIYVDHNGECYSINKALSVTPLNKKIKDNHCSLVDSEMIDGTPYLFDCLIYKKKDLRNEYFAKRYEKLENFSGDWKIKKFAFKNIQKESEKIWKAKHPYKLDGLIFTPLDKSYVEQSLKWKPTSMQTADFLVYKEKDKWILFAQSSFHYIKKNRIKIPYDKFPFLDPNKKLGTYPIEFTTTTPPKNSNNKTWPNLSIIEFKWEDDHWVPERIRKDKTEQMLNAIKNGEFNGPNGMKTIKNVIYSINNPIKEEWLFGKEDLPEVYYTGNNKGRSNIMRKFHNKIKSDLYNQFIKKGDNVLELAGGRGGDLGKLAKIGAKRVVMTDIAKNGISEAERRYEEMKEKNKNNIGNMKVDFIEANATKDITPLLPKRLKYQVVSIMFAFHYFIKSFKTTFVNIDHNLKKGGYLLVTTFDKDLITEMNTPAFRVKLKNNNKVSVYAESIGERNEYLVDYDWLVSEMEKRKYKLVYNKTFKELSKDFNNKMTPDEQQFSFMNRAVVFQKE